MKHASPQLKQMLQHVEEKMLEQFISKEIPPEFQAIFLERMREGKDDSLEGLLLEFADKLDQFYEAFAELKRGNTDKEYIQMYQTALGIILDLPLPTSVEYFSNNILVDAMNEKTHIDVTSLTKEILNKKHR